MPGAPSPPTIHSQRVVVVVVVLLCGELAYRGFSLHPGLGSLKSPALPPDWSVRACH